MEATPDWGCFVNYLGGASQIFRVHCQAGHTSCSSRGEYFNIAEPGSCGTLHSEIIKSNPSFIKGSPVSYTQMLQVRLKTVHRYRHQCWWRITIEKTAPRWACVCHAAVQGLFHHDKSIFCVNPAGFCASQGFPRLSKEAQAVTRPVGLFFFSFFARIGAEAHLREHSIQTQHKASETRVVTGVLRRTPNSFVILQSREKVLDCGVFHTAGLILTLSAG